MAVVDLHCFLQRLERFVRFMLGGLQAGEVVPGLRRIRCYAEHLFHDAFRARQIAHLNVGAGNAHQHRRIRSVLT